MKFKKSWIFWICYYGAAIIGNVLAAILLRDKWNFNAWSAFPILYILFTIFWVWYFPSEHHANLCDEYCIRYLKSRDKYLDEEKWRITQETYEQQEDRKKKSKAGEKFMINSLLFVIPLYGKYIFFFSNLAKGLSCIVPMILLLIAIVGLLIWLDDSPKFRKQREKELKEQQEREELGRWK